MIKEMIDKIDKWVKLFHSLPRLLWNETDIYPFPGGALGRMQFILDYIDKEIDTQRRKVTA